MHCWIMGSQRHLHLLGYRMVTHCICVKDASNGDTSIYEKDDEEITIYDVGSVKHYIMTNEDWRNAVWVYKTYECSISGDLPEATIKRMIDSIYER